MSRLNNKTAQAVGKKDSYFPIRSWPPGYPNQNEQRAEEGKQKADEQTEYTTTDQNLKL